MRPIRTVSPAEPPKAGFRAKPPAAGFKTAPYGTMRLRLRAHSQKWANKTISVSRYAA